MGKTWWTSGTYSTPDMEASVCTCFVCHVNLSKSIHQTIRSWIIYLYILSQRKLGDFRAGSWWCPDHNNGAAWFYSHWLLWLFSFEDKKHSLLSVSYSNCEFICCFFIRQLSGIIFWFSRSMRFDLNFSTFLVQFMALLVLRHTLPLLIDGADQYSFTLFSVKL